MKYVLGIDFGGGSAKATLLGEDGRIYAENNCEYQTYHPFAGACEQKPEEWYDALCLNVKQIMEKSGIRSSEIVCVAVDSATHTAVLCDQNGKPVRDAIHWTDSRSTEEAEELKKHNQDMILEKAFHKPDTIWTLPQLLWLKKHEPEHMDRLCHLLFEKDYLRYRLTGVICTDYIEAEGSMLFDVRNMEWSKELCALANISSTVLPKLCNPLDVIGGITEEAGRQTGLLEGTPVICGSTDTVMEMFAAGSVREGCMTVKLATAGRICIITSQPYPHAQLINYSHVIPGLWYPGTATKSCASSYRWYRDTFDGDYETLNEGAGRIAPGCDGLMFHPYLNGELTPYADPQLCGSFTGVLAMHTKAHFTRAVLEGVAFSLLDCMATIKEVGITHEKQAVLIGGGAKGALWRQIVADMLGMELKTTKNSDSSLGSAMLAGIAAGFFRDYEEAATRCVEVTGVTLPNAENTAYYQRLFPKYKAIHDALAPISHQYRE